MLLALDVGNTNITTGSFRATELMVTRRVPTEMGSTTEGLAAALDLDGVSEIVLASVVPAVTASVTQLCARRGVNLLVADAGTIPLPVQVDQPGHVGADRLVNAFAGSRLYGKPVIVVDLGTATTFDVVDAQGAFVGGAIAPGIDLGAEALAARTALLPRVALELPAHAIGTSTVTAMQSGIVIGYIGLVRELVATITAELAGNRGPQPKVILTGGWSQADWAEEIRADAIDPHLTLRGLALLHAEVGAGIPAKATA